MRKVLVASRILIVPLSQTLIISQKLNQLSIKTIKNKIIVYHNLSYYLVSIFFLYIKINTNNHFGSIYNEIF